MGELLPADLHLLRPWWLLALLPVAALLWRWAQRRSGASHWESAVAPELLNVLLAPTQVRGSRWLAAISGVVAVMTIVGLAGPTWQQRPQPVEQRNNALVVLFDMSWSMYAEDLRPSRLARARHKITDLLRLRTEGFTGLVAYAGDAHAVAPLTDDVRTIENLLGALQPDIMPVPGSNPLSALEIARDLFHNAHVQQGRILLVTDGVDDIDEVTRFSDRAFPISILGVGTDAGAAIPLHFINRPNDFLSSRDGARIIARLDESRLQNIAALCHGRYSRLTLGAQDIGYLLDTPLPSADETIEVDRVFDTWVDQGYWAALALLPILLLGFRRGLLAGVALALWVPVPGYAGVWDDLWERRDQQALSALRTGAPETAAALFEDPRWRAIANYRSGAWDVALDAFAQDHSATGIYNLGNALARLGEFEQAIEAYDEVLRQQPRHEDAAFNRSLLERLMEEQQNASEQDNNEQQREGARRGDEARERLGGDDQQREQSEQQRGRSEKMSGEISQSDQEASAGEQQELTEAQDDEQSRSERRDALEQWLRRVPDDPGGLLRRKFQYETNQRLRRGEYRDRARDKSW